MVTKTMIYFPALPDTDKNGQITLLQPGMYNDILFPAIHTGKRDWAYARQILHRRYSSVGGSE